MRIAEGLSIEAASGQAAREAAGRAVEGLAAAPASLAVVVASPHHAEAAREVLEAVHEVVRPGALIGCVAEAVVGGRREIERSPAISVWAAALPEAVESFHMDFLRTESGGAFTGWRFEPDPDGRLPVHLMIADPFTFPADLLLEHLNEQVPGALVVGGLAGGASRPGDTVLFQDHAVHHEGAVGVRLSGKVVVRTLVSQGCRPIGQ